MLFLAKLSLIVLDINLKKETTGRLFIIQEKGFPALTTDFFCTLFYKNES